MLLDLGRLKQINDIHGDDLGDKALATVGQITPHDRRELERRGTPLRGVAMPVVVPK